MVNLELRDTCACSEVNAAAMGIVTIGGASREFDLAAMRLRAVLVGNKKLVHATCGPNSELDVASGAAMRVADGKNDIAGANSLLSCGLGVRSRACL